MRPLQHFSDKIINYPTTLDYILNPQLSVTNDKTQIRFINSCLKQEEITSNHSKFV